MFFSFGGIPFVSISVEKEALQSGYSRSPQKILGSGARILLSADDAIQASIKARKSFCVAVVGNCCYIGDTLRDSNSDNGFGDGECPP